MVGGFPENFVFTTEIAQPFMKRVEEESGGALTVSLQGPDAVPTFEQFEPVQAGAALTQVPKSLATHGQSLQLFFWKMHNVRAARARGAGTASP